MLTKVDKSARPLAPQGRSQKCWKRIWRYRSLYLMLIPGIISVFIFHYIPVYGIQIAFKDFRNTLGIWGSEWADPWYKWFKQFFNYPYFTRILWNTLRLNLLGMLFFPASLVFALMLNEMRDGKFKKVCQTITYAPHFISTVLVCGMAILFLGRNGLFNIIGAWIGGSSYEVTDYMSRPGVFPWVYVLSGVWGELGWGTIIYLATLSSVSPELVEAARMDGASRMQIIRHVYLPHLMPTVITMFILSMGNLLATGFEKVYLLQNPLNLEVSEVLSTYVYETGIGMKQYSYSTAINLFNNLVSIIMVTITNFISKKTAKSGLW
mgnify:FL=1